jgi:6-phosphogluconolactonase
VLNELRSTITAFSYDVDHGDLHALKTISALPMGFSGENTAAEIAVHPNGKFLYASNRGNDTIAVFAIDSGTGELTLVDHFSTQGKTPRDFKIDPTGRLLLVANQDSNNIVVFRIDPNSGRLAPTGQTLEVPSPVALKFMPAE